MHIWYSNSTQMHIYRYCAINELLLLTQATHDYSYLPVVVAALVHQFRVNHLYWNASSQFSPSTTSFS
jgi:hypothetical protein